MKNWGSETLVNHYYEQLPGSSSRNDHTTRKEKRDDLISYQQKVKWKLNAAIYETAELSFRLFAANSLSTKTELRVGLPNRKLTLRTKIENDKHVISTKRRVQSKDCETVQPNDLFW